MEDLDLPGRLLAKARRLATPCGGGDLVWHTWGEPSPGRVPVVLLHGGSGSWTHWIRNIEPLVALGHHLIVPDLPGFGDSQALPGSSDADAIVVPLEAGLAQLLGDAPCRVVGFSFGGLTAGLWLAQHPARATRLVLVGAPAMGVVPQRQFELKGWRHLPEGEARRDIHRHNLAALMLHDPALIEGLALRLHEENVARDRMPRRRLAHTDALARALPAIACPVHAIYGERDALYKSWITDLEAAYRRVTPDLRGFALIEGAGHWVQFEAPERFDAELARALVD